MSNGALRVGILPAHEYEARPRLWAALEATHPVRFQPRDAGQWQELDAIVRLGEGLFGDASADLPSLHALGEEGAGGEERVLEMADSGVLARPLRGALLSDAHAVVLRSGDEQGAVLASLDGEPAWTVSSPEGVAHHRVSCAPAELADGEALRERLQAGRCLALVALVHFLRDLDPDFREPPLHAGFVIDDPNLHWPSYGHINYQRLLAHAGEHGYHVAIAMAPLDGWLAHPRAVRLFREGTRHLSICIHGNDHDGPELGRPESWQESLALADQALRRSAAFERRTGLTVERVMVPPHERVSEPAARALKACGFEAICTTRPYPWIASSAAVSWLQGPPEAGALSGWGPAESVAGGLPMLLRTDFRYPRSDHVLRAFLGQPMILYGHHDLLSDGLEVFAQATAELNGLGDVRWSSLGEMARACSPQPQASASHPEQIPARPLRVRPILRRLASEGRDRLQAVV